MSEVVRSKGRILVTALIANLGIAQIAFAVQITTQEACSGDPCSGKIFVAGWLESEMWVNPWFLLAGVSTLIVAVSTFFVYPRLTGATPR
jgi:hypothetical protein